MKIFMIILFANLINFASILKAEPAKTQVAFVAELVDGKKYWTTIPADVVFKKGQNVKAKIINLMQEPHGFEIKGIVAPMVINPGAQEIDFVVPKTMSGTQSVLCQLHPAHQPSSFIVK